MAYVAVEDGQPLHDAYGYDNLGDNAEPFEDDAGEENSGIHVNTRR
jgi:hypothetical protein